MPILCGKSGRSAPRRFAYAAVSGLTKESGVSKVRFQKVHTDTFVRVAGDFHSSIFPTRSWLNAASVGFLSVKVVTITLQRGPHEGQGLVRAKRIYVDES